MNRADRVGSCMPLCSISSFMCVIFLFPEISCVELQVGFKGRRAKKWRCASLWCPGLPYFLACLPSQLCTVATRVNKAFQELSSLLSYDSCASAQGSAVSLSHRGNCSLQTCFVPLMFTHACAEARQRSVAMSTGETRLIPGGNLFTLPVTAEEGPSGSVTSRSRGIPFTQQGSEASDHHAPK